MNIEERTKMAGYNRQADIRGALRAGTPQQSLVARLVVMGWPAALAKSEVDIAAAALRKPQVQVVTRPRAVQPQPEAQPPHAGTDPLHDTNTLVYGGRRMPVLLSAGAGACHVTLIEDVITDAEIDHLIVTARPQLSRATVVADDAKAGVDARRTSDRCWLQRGCDPIVAGIEARLSALAGIPVERGEGLQILHYATDQEYQPHFDYFTQNTQFERDTVAKSGNRVGTLILYLADTDAGGCTYFPVLDMSVHPRRGAAMWFSYLPGGKVDPRSKHGGTPVVRGEKWIATKWFRERPFVG